MPGSDFTLSHRPDAGKIPCSHFQKCFGPQSAVFRASFSAPNHRPGQAVVQSPSYAPLFSTPWTAARQSSLAFTISWSLLKLMSSESTMPSNHLILCHPFLLLPSIFPSVKVLSNELVLPIRWPQYWSFNFSFSFNFSPSRSGWVPQYVSED